MRDILFRGKDAENGQWIYGYYIGGNNHIDTHEICDINDVLMCMVEVNPETVGQFTGLTDKNGKKIFEGDIVKGLFLFGMEIKAVVVFQDGAFGLQWNRGGVKTFSAFTSICNVQYEIVGNIHDNPELMEVTE